MWMLHAFHSSAPAPKHRCDYLWWHVIEELAGRVSVEQPSVSPLWSLLAEVPPPVLVSFSAPLSSPRGTSQSSCDWPTPTRAPPWPGAEVETCQARDDSRCRRGRGCDARAAVSWTGRCWQRRGSETGMPRNHGRWPSPAPPPGLCPALVLCVWTGRGGLAAA